MTLPENSADRHREVAGTFTRVALAVTDWDAPTPVAQWTTRDVVGHLTTWFPGFLLDAAGIDVAASVDVAQDPVRAWTEQAQNVQRVLDDPERSAQTFEHQHIGPQSVTSCIDMIYTPDVFMHSWDLARGAGVDLQLDPDFAATMLSGMTAMEDAMRSSGQYGPAVTIPADAPEQHKLLAFIGRNPYWPDEVPSLES